MAWHHGGVVGHDGRVQLVRHPSRRMPPVAFAHRGARAQAPENTLEAFELALTLGATGLESDVWITADGELVLDHDGVVRQGWRKRPVAQVERSALPEHVPTIHELWDHCGADHELSIDVKDPAAGAPLIEAALARGVAERLWVCQWDLDLLVEWRERYGDAVRLVYSTRLRRLEGGPERAAARLASAGIDAVNLHSADWTGGLTTLFHRFDLEVLGWDAQHDRVVRDLVRMGIDGVFSDHVERMVRVMEDEVGPLRPTLPPDADG